jgi:hypothetical protein
MQRGEDKGERDKGQGDKTHIANTFLVSPLFLVSLSMSLWQVR